MIEYKRILRNMGMLYLRMLLAMVIGLYTVRVVIAELGVEDFGIFHVVVGIVALLGFIQGAMTALTQRYFAYDLGESRGSKLQDLYNTALQIHILLAVGIVVIAETIGLWFLSTQINIPSGRLDAVQWVYHLSVVTFFIQFMNTPLIAMIIAQERMELYAAISIVDVLLKLVAVLLLPHFVFDKIIVYASLLLVASLFTFNIYLIVNRAVFPVVRMQWCWDAKQFRKMFEFTVWSSWGHLSAALSLHGNNILLNIFFGPIVNAGRNIANQANVALNGFVYNAQAAVNPQIFKQYASGQQALMHNLVERASKYNFLILISVSSPVIFYTEQLLQIWLVTPPRYADIFLKLTIVVSLIDSLSMPMMTSAQATGNLRLYQTVIGGILLLNVPVAFIVLKFWQDPILVLLVSILSAAVALIGRLFIMQRLTGMPINRYLRSVLARLIVLSFLTGVANYFLALCLVSWLSLVGALSTCFMITLLGAYLIGLNGQERLQLNKKILEKFKEIANVIFI